MEGKPCSGRRESPRRSPARGLRRTEEGHYYLTIVGAVGRLGKRALKQSALKDIPHGFRLWWMVGGDLKKKEI